MFTAKLLATLSLGLLAAACASPYDRQAAVPPSGPTNISRAASASERNCMDYGFNPGSAPYDRCVQREMSARQAGRVARDYDQARLTDDARGACLDYGLERGSPRYDNCVARELDARRYTEQGQMSVPAPYVETQRYVETPRYVEPTRYVEPQPAATGVQTFHDEYGFRYDAEGNRLDRNGRIIDPHSTTP